ncbi:MAG: hypothetical protein JO202_13925 [Ktedonobacteraceae bacterium]|nr:hypothetical protein [Ktedonobacteraceae bacterium]
MPFKDKDRYQSEEWKEYQRNYQHSWHQRHRAKRLARMYERKAAIHKYIQNMKNQLCCVNCGQRHPATLHFHHLNSEDKVFNISMEYQREYQKGWYQQHKEKLVARREQDKIEILNWFRRYKSTLRCMDCDISHPAVLQFHHRNKGEKKMAVSALVSRASSLKQITNEIKKCDVLCANCHAKLHWRETHETDNWEEVIPEA